ncbi:MAG: tetratricopeptide repeat protein, partial [Thermoanaerobaculales bacterium]|nr:tetratricopeptide repeat protein [Thermoanaerobaculales bacterium]
KQLKQDDEFVSAAEWIFRWVADNRRQLLAAIGAVFAAAIVWWGVNAWMGTRTDDASLLLYHAVQTFEGDAAAGSLVPGGDVDAAQIEFQQVVESYGRSDQADMAKLYLARIALSRGQTDEARSVFVDLSQKHGNDVIGRLATLDLIDLRIASGQVEEVAGELEAMIVSQDGGLPRAAALYKLGEVFVTSGDPERARTYFERLVEEFPESPYLMNARLRLNELG